MPLRLSLQQFVRRVHSACLARVDQGPFPSDQKQLLHASLERLAATSSAEDWGQPLGLFYAIYRVCGAEQDAVAALLAQFSALYIASADLFDDVQDDDLKGKPHEHAGPAIATNSALALLTLALDALGEASELETRPDRVLSYLRVFNRTSLVAVGAQHRDLLGFGGAKTTREVEEMHRGKTSSLALLCEVAAWAGGASPTTVAAYYRLGESLAAAVQVIDDVRDLVAKEESVDLMTGKSTYPLACFYESVKTAHKVELANLLKHNPIDLEAVRSLLETHGAFDRCAEAVERHRQTIFELLESTERETQNTQGASGHRRLLAEIVDHLVSALYEPPPLSRASEEQPGPFFSAATAHAQMFMERLRAHGMQNLPQMRRWHLPSFLYVPDQETIYVSDVDALPEEVADFHSQVQMVSPDVALETVRTCLPFVMAHELTHAFRDQLGLLGQDAWHEEFVANRVAFAYVQRYFPAVSRAVLASSRQILRVQPPGSQLAWQQQIVSSCVVPHETARDYDCTPEQAARVHAAMLLKIFELPGTWEQILAQWLPVAASTAAE